MEVTESVVIDLHLSWCCMSLVLFLVVVLQEQKKLQSCIQKPEIHLRWQRNGQVSTQSCILWLDYLQLHCMYCIC